LTGRYTPADAQSRLQELSTIPIPQLQLLQTSGPKVLAAQSQLVALGKVPASALARLKGAQSAASDSPKRWRNYFWMARREDRAEREHEAMAEQELAKLRG
jgi:hypothetical protein